MRYLKKNQKIAGMLHGGSAPRPSYCSQILSLI